MIRITPERRIFCSRAAGGEGRGHHAGDVVQEGEQGGEEEVVQGYKEGLEDEV